MSSIKTKLKAQQYQVKEVNGVKFTLKKMDFLQFQRLAGKLKNSETTSSDFEIELILSCITNATGIKVKDIAENKDEFSEIELEEVLDYDKEYVEMFLGKNQDVLIELYKVIAEDFLTFTEKANKKKINLDTEQKE